MRRILPLVLVAAAVQAAPASATQADTTRVGGVVVQRGGADVGFDPSAPRPVRRAGPRFEGPAVSALPAAVVEAAPFPVDPNRPPTDSVAAPTAGLRVGARVWIRGAGAHAPGTRLQAWRPGSDVDGVGPVAVPTATLTVTSAREGGVDAVVDALHDRLAPGQPVRLLPPAPVVVASALDAVSSGRRVRLLGAPTPRAVLQPGDWVFLDAGASAGLRPADEFVPVDGPTDVREGARLQVVAVHPSTAMARILRVGPVLLQPGRMVRLDRRAR